MHFPLENKMVWIWTKEKKLAMHLIFNSLRMLRDNRRASFIWMNEWMWWSETNWNEKWHHNFEWNIEEELSLEVFDLILWLVQQIVGIYLEICHVNNHQKYLAKASISHVLYLPDSNTNNTIHKRNKCKPPEMETVCWQNVHNISSFFREF